MKDGCNFFFFLFRESFYFLHLFSLSPHHHQVAEMWATDAEKAVEKVLEATVDLGVSCSTGMTR